MELWLPEQIPLGDVTRQMLEDVATTARRVDSTRPLPSDVVRRIEDSLLGERVYSSNAIEGNTLDLRETVMVLRQGTGAVRKQREATEARNLGYAAARIADLVQNEGQCFTEQALLECHRTILADINDEWAGRFRDRRVMITGAKEQPPDHTHVPTLVARVMERLRAENGIDPVCLAAWCHWALARIHPFMDGNGRIARLWQDLVLLRAHHTCAVIRPEDRREYLDALAQADEGKLDALVQLVARSLANTLDKYLAELERDERFDDFVRELAGEADARIHEQRQLSYQRWCRKMEQLRWEFESCASRLTDASRELRVQIRPFDMIDQDRWENIRSGRGATKTWFFIVDFWRASQHRQYCFFFGKHYWIDELDSEQDRAEQRTCLLLSEHAGGSQDQDLRLDQTDDRQVTLREVFVSQDDKLVRKRIDPASGDIVYDRDILALDIAKEFMREVVLSKLTA